MPIDLTYLRGLLPLGGRDTGASDQALGTGYSDECDLPVCTLVAGGLLAEANYAWECVLVALASGVSAHASRVGHLSKHSLAIAIHRCS